jgi:hypothetical protein
MIYLIYFKNLCKCHNHKKIWKKSLHNAFLQT